jgi:UDP-N-acetyl-D-glucosamine dehydrogenase
VVGKVRAALNARKKSVNGARILVLGVAYKRDVNDIRESPALDVIGLLAADGADVVYHDPYVPELTEDGTRLSSIALTDEALTEADAVVIVTDHTDVDYARVLEQSAVLVDARHVTARFLDDSRVDEGGSRAGAWIVKGGPE